MLEIKNKIVIFWITFWKMYNYFDRIKIACSYFS